MILMIPSKIPIFCNKVIFSLNTKNPASTISIKVKIEKIDIAFEMASYFKEKAKITVAIM